MTTDRAAVYPRRLPHHRPLRQQPDGGRLKARLRPMRGLKRDRSLRTVAAGHAFLQNVRRGHYELAVDVPVQDRVAVALAELAAVI